MIANMIIKGSSEMTGLGQSMSKGAAIGCAIGGGAMMVGKIGALTTSQGAAKTVGQMASAAKTGGFDKLGNILQKGSDSLNNMNTRNSGTSFASTSTGSSSGGGGTSSAGSPSGSASDSGTSFASTSAGSSSGASNLTNNQKIGNILKKGGKSAAKTVERGLFMGQRPISNFAGTYRNIRSGLKHAGREIGNELLGGQNEMENLKNLKNFTDNLKK